MDLLLVLQCSNYFSCRSGTMNIEEVLHFLACLHYSHGGTVVFLVAGEYTCHVFAM